MDLVSGYADSDEEELEEGNKSYENITISKSVNNNFKTIDNANNKSMHQSNKNVAVVASNKISTKRIKKLDISFLPLEIQAALMHGDSMKDSDDEVDDKKRYHAQITKKPSIQDANSSQLLSLLPPPKLPSNSSKQDIENNNPNADKPINQALQYNENEDFSSLKEDNDDIDTTNPLLVNKVKENLVKSSFSFGYTSTEIIRTNEDGNSNSIDNKVVNIHKKDKLAKKDILPWFQTEKKPLVEMKRPNMSFTIPQPISLSNSSQQSQSYHSNNYQIHSKHMDKNNDDDDEIVDHQPTNKKKRERDIELQLMSGDLTALHNTTKNISSVKDLSIDHLKWDQQKYTDQQIREQEIQKGFGIGTNKSLMQVTKQQNRKHQLNSLAIKAAETELALLEKRGNRIITKSETQGKYGW